MAFPTTGVLDNFNRTNGGPPPSASWVNSASLGLKVVGNECQPDSSDDGASWDTSFAADQECFADISAVPSVVNKAIILYARLQTKDAWFTADNYEIDCTVKSGTNNDEIEVWKQVSTVWTEFGAGFNIGADWQIGDQIGIDVIGTTIRAFINGTEKRSETDSDVSGAGYIGAGFTDANGEAIDDFGGGAIVVPSGTRRIFVVG